MVDQVSIKRIPAPICDEELALLSTWYFGKALRFRYLSVHGDYGSYEVDEDYDSYHGKGFAYSSYSCEGYDSSAYFWRIVTGGLTGGGIARASYGQFKIDGHRNAVRLAKWVSNRAAKRISTPRRVFVRLAADVGGGERARIRGMRQVTYVREDAA